MLSRIGNWLKEVLSSSFTEEFQGSNHARRGLFIFRRRLVPAEAGKSLLRSTPQSSAAQPLRAGSTFWCCVVAGLLALWPSSSSQAAMMGDMGMSLNYALYGTSAGMTWWNSPLEPERTLTIAGVRTDVNKDGFADFGTVELVNPCGYIVFHFCSRIGNERVVLGQQLIRWIPPIWTGIPEDDDDDHRGANSEIIWPDFPPYDPDLPPPPPPVVPEPTSMALLAGGVASILLRRRRA